MIVDKKLVVSNRKKADIVAELRTKEFRPFPKISKAKASGETEDVVEEEESTKESTNGGADYDYLLGMAIWSLTQEKVRTECDPLPISLLMNSQWQIEKLLQQGREKEAELLELLKISPVDMWNTDLDNLLLEWRVRTPQ